MNTSRRNVLGAAAGAAILAATGATVSPARAVAQPVTGNRAIPSKASWRSQSLREETVRAANGAITTREAAEANEHLAMSERRAIEIAPDLWLLAGFGLAQSMAIRAPEGWIIVDTGSSTGAAQDMRNMLEAAVGGPIRVAAILYTHWHYTNGTAAWLDEGAEIWGHEWLDRNRTEGRAAGPLAGVSLVNSAVQFGLFHPTEGPDAMPNNLSFSSDVLFGEMTYSPPQRLFQNGVVERFTIAGEVVEVMPNRSDASDSVGFYLPRLRALISSFMAQGFIFNIYSLRGGPYRDPDAFLEDNRRMESYDAAILLDLHAAPVTGEIASWRWAMRLTSLLLQLDPTDESARKTRAVTARALGQRTTSANARGWYLTEAMELEGQLHALGVPITVAQVRGLLGTPEPEDLVASGTGASMSFLQVLVDPERAGDRRAAFTLHVAGDAAPWRIELRNGVVLTDPATEPMPEHVTLTPEALAGFVLGLEPPTPATPLAVLDGVLDRSAFMFIPAAELEALKGMTAELQLLGPGAQ